MSKRKSIKQENTIDVTQESSRDSKLINADLHESVELKLIENGDKGDYGKSDEFPEETYCQRFELTMEKVVNKYGYKIMVDKVPKVSDMFPAGQKIFSLNMIEARL